MSALTVDAAVMTDAVRLTNAQGDGLAYPDSSMGMWPQRTNYIRRGGFETAITDYNTAGGTATLTRDTGTFKFGTASLKIACIDNLSLAQLASMPNGTLVAGNTYTFSVWVWSDGSINSVRLEGANGISGTTNSGPLAISAVKKRLTFTFVAAAPGSVYLSVRNQTGGAGTFWTDGWQCEDGAFATPYIETNGANVTRSGGSAYLASDLYNRLSLVQGWIAFRYRPEVPITVDTTMNLFGFGIQGDLTKMMELTWRSNASATQSFAVARRASAAGNSNATKTNIAWTPGTPLTIVMFWTATQIGVSVNGSAFVTTNIALTAFVPNFFILGDSVRGPNDSPANGEQLWCMIGNGTIVQADSITLNNQGDTDPGLGLLGATAQTVAVIPFTNTVVSSYVDAPVTNDLAGTASLAGAGMTYVQGGGAHVASGTLAGSGTTLLQGGGTHTATGSLTGAGVVYENGGFAFFADSSFSGAGIRYVQGGGEFDGVSAFGGAGDLIRAAGPTLHGRISRSRVGRVKHR